MFQALTRQFSNNFYVIIGIVIGLYLSSFVSFTIEPLCSTKTLQDSLINNESVDRKPALVSNNNQIPAKKPQAPVASGQKRGKIIRPRYYSTELGIREKLFLGIFTSEEKIESLVVPLNQTLQHVTNQIKFFITAQYKLKNKVNLSGLVGFTDTRPRYRPFQVLKYIGDNFGQDYDFYFLSNDYTFISPHKLNDLVKEISVSMDVYLGTRIPDGSYCNLEAGIVLSNSVVKAVREHLDWCIINAITDDYSENLGRCIHHSIGLTCQETVQGQSLNSFKLKHFELKQHLVDLTKLESFNKAITVHPLLEGENFHLLNAYFLKQRLQVVKAKIDYISQELTEIWPPGQKPGAKPLTRFDLPRQFYFNMTHVFFPDDFTNVRAHTQSELADIVYILEEIKLKFRHSDKFQFRRLINGYRTFDLSRGLDYVLDLGFRDLHNGRETVKRFEVCKPLGKVELLSVPYVTENSRVTILLPVEESDVEAAKEFLHRFRRDILDRKEKTFVMLVFLYQFASSAKGIDDKFSELKNYATKTSNKYKSDDLKIAWLSIRLPEAETATLANSPSLNFAIVDLALKKIGLESLILVLGPYTSVTVDFLNRVRMNTVPGYQIFSPIPFRQYNPKITTILQLDVNKDVGHFDKEEYRFISFFSKDYVNARKLYQKKLPIVRVDNDISLVLSGNYRLLGNIFEMFLQEAREIHAMRATEMGLRVKYHEFEDGQRCNMFLGNKIQLGRLLLSQQDKFPELFEK